MTTPLQIPTATQVKAACERFDKENHLVEQTLTELFREHPRNDEPSRVLLKVVAVNALYQTSIFALETVARHIHANHSEIDAALASGSPSAVEMISKINVQGRKYNFYSFATKYCNWHNPSEFPIYDTHIDHYLWTLQEQHHFAAFQHAEMCDYPKFRGIVAALRDKYSLGAFSFKEIDKFLFVQCERPALPVAEEPQTGPGAFDFFPTVEVPS
jgi:hypothetical protein